MLPLEDVIDASKAEILAVHSAWEVRSLIHVRSLEETLGRLREDS